MPDDDNLVELAAAGVGYGAWEYIRREDRPNWTGYPRWVPRRLRRTRLVRIVNPPPWWGPAAAAAFKTAAMAGVVGIASVAAGSLDDTE